MKQKSEPRPRFGRVRAILLVAEHFRMSFKKRALIVDDEENQRTGLAEMLASFGIEPLTATDGQDAIEKLASFHADVILADLVMPRIDGFDLLRHLSEQGSVTPTIILTGSRTYRIALPPAVENAPSGEPRFANRYSTRSNRPASLLLRSWVLVFDLKSLKVPAISTEPASHWKDLPVKQYW